MVHIFRLGKPFLGFADLRTDNDVEIVHDNYFGTFSMYSHVSISERVKIDDNRFEIPVFLDCTDKT